jgi:hypothetical protein
VVHGASCVTGVGLHITLAPVSSQEPLQLDCAGGAREAAGSDRPRGGELHHNATHWRSPLIERKDRVPNTLYKRCAASVVGSTLVGCWRLTQNTADFNRPVRRWLRSVGAELGWLSPSIAHAIISLCSMADWHSQCACQRGTCGRATANSDGHRR